MAILTQRKILNVIPGTAAQLTVHCSQSDTGSEVAFELYAGSEPFAPVGTASVQGVRKDGSGFGPVGVTLSSNVATVTLTTDMTGVAGPAICELTITETGGTVSTANFAILVEEAAFPNGPLVENSVDVYEQILAYVQSFPAGAAADATLKVAAEAAARQAADASLQTQIGSEVVAREAADTDLQAQITAIRGAVGSPLVAAAVADMTDTDRIYVYTGAETGYTAGDWYYWDGSAWVSGGVYNSAAVNTDPTLSVSGMPADAKVTGDDLTAIRDALIFRTVLPPYGKAPLPGMFVRGNITSSGNLTAALYRVRQNAVQKALEAITVSVNAGYKYDVVYYSSSAPSSATLVSRTGWQGGSYTIPANSLFMLLIRADPEDTTITADLAWQNEVFVNIDSLTQYMTEEDEAWEG